MRVVLATERSDLHDALQFFLTEAAIAMTASVSDPQDLLPQARATSPDIAIVDWSLDEGRTTDAVKRLRKKHRQLGILALGTRAEHESQALAAGADAYLTIRASNEARDALKRSTETQRFHDSADVPDDRRPLASTRSTESVGTPWAATSLPWNDRND